MTFPTGRGPWTLAVLLLVGCSTYQAARPIDQIPLPAAERERFEVWSAGKSYQLHSLKSVGDSVQGVPWWKDPTCDSCRVTLARSAVDSVRVPGFAGNETGAMVLAMTPFVALGALILMLQGLKD